jgi:hypothetical protein
MKARERPKAPLSFADRVTDRDIVPPATDSMGALIRYIRIHLKFCIHVKLWGVFERLARRLARSSGWG